MNKTLSLLFLTLFSMSVFAAPILSTSDPALLGAVTEDFNSSGTGGFTNLVLTDVTVTGGTFSLSDSANGQYAPPNPAGDIHILASNSTLNFEFNSLQSAFGIQIGATNHVQTLTAYDNMGGVLEILSIPDQVQDQPYPYTGFYGIAAGSAVIKSFSVTNVADGVVYDDLMYTQVSSVPAPASLLLFAVALFGFNRRR